MTSVTEYTVTFETISLENTDANYFNNPVFIEAFMGNSRKRTPKITLPSNSSRNYPLSHKIIQISPILKELEIWIREDRGQKFIVGLFLKIRGIQEFLCLKSLMNMGNVKEKCKLRFSKLSFAICDTS